MKGHKPTMNDFGSNNLVLHVHVLYLNIGTQWRENEAWAQPDTLADSTSMANGQTNSTIMMSNASRSQLQKMG